MAKIRMRFTVEIPDDKETLRKMIELFNMASNQVHSEVSDRTKNYFNMARELNKIFEIDNYNDLVKERRDYYAGVGKQYIDAQAFAEDLEWLVHNRLIQVMEEMEAENASKS
jgi:hypothetical protein